MRETTIKIVDEGPIVQGEGYWTGTEMYHYRAAGCNVHCKWCDTNYDEDAKDVEYEDVRQKLRTVGLACRHSRACVLITGGEPLRQPALVDAIRYLLIDLSNLYVHIETNGSFGLDDLVSDRLWVACSPKWENSYCIWPGLQIDELKYVADDHLLPSNVHTSPAYNTWIMPCDYGPRNKAKTRASIQKAIAIAHETGARLGIQAHKFWGIK
jgi:organic radical activating enzyme